MCVGTSVPQQECGGQRRTVLLWVLGIELRLWGLAANAFTPTLPLHLPHIHCSLSLANGQVTIQMPQFL